MPDRTHLPPEAHGVEDPDDPLDTDSEEFESEAGGGATSDEGIKLGGIVPDLIRKAVVAGLGAVFMTEEGIRTVAGQMKLPKELLGLILAQADKTKVEVSRVIGEELRRFLNSELVRKELLQTLSGMTVEIKAEVRLRPDPDANGHVLPKIELTDSSLQRGKSKKEKEHHKEHGKGHKGEHD